MALLSAVKLNCSFGGPCTGRRNPQFSPMGGHAEKTFVPFEPQQMFDLVAAIDDYPRFIPWVEALRVKERRVIDGQGEVIADMVVGYKMFRESFRSRVVLDRANGGIIIDYIRGPLRSLKNTWWFEPDTNGCIVHFDISFEFKNILMQTVASQLIDKAFNRLSGAFVEEAHRRYTQKLSKNDEICLE